MQATDLIIHNSAGAMVYQKTISKDYSGILDLDLSTYENGMYLV